MRPRFGNLLKGLLVVLVWLAWGLPARAQAADPVVSHAAARALRVRVAHAQAGSSTAVSRLVTRLGAELRVAGFDVEVVGIGREAIDEERQSNDTLREGYARVVIDLKDERLNLDIATRSLDTSSHIVLTGLEREVPALALQAAEFLRAGLIPRARPRAPTATSLTPQPSTNPGEAPRGALWLDAGGTFLTNVGAADRLALLSLGAGYRWPSKVSVGITADIPVLGGAFDAPEGVADYRLWQGALHADYAWLTWSGGEATLGLCGGLALVTATGREGVSRSLRSEVWALSLGARLAARFDLTDRFAIVGSVRALGLSPNPVVAVVDAERRLGSPALLFGLGWRVGRHR